MAKKVKEVKIDDVVKVIDEPIKGGAVKAKKPNAWLSHVKKYRADNPDKPYKECLQEAKKTYKKGGALEVKPADAPIKMEKASADPAPVKKMKKVKKVKKVKTIE